MYPIQPGALFSSLNWETYLAATEAMNEGIWIITAQPQEVG